MNPEKIFSRVDGFAMVTAIVAGLAAAGAAMTTPTGLTAFGIWLGLVDEPLIVTAAPILDKLATVSGTISGFSYFYARRQIRKLTTPSAPEPSAKMDES